MAYTSERPRSFFLLTLLTALVGAPGCDTPEAGKQAERVATNAAPIINGTPDTTHTAVVAVLGNNFSCSGTILQVANGRGYVLTAGHCCPAGNFPNQVVIGNNYQTGTPHAIVAGTVVRDSCYDNCPGSTDDVCMLQFNAPAGTPFIPPMTPATDNLSPGVNLTYVGYGITASPPGGFNSTRRTVTKPIDTVDSYFISYANPSVSGTCEGDSGGPALEVVNGVEQVAGVTSYGDQACTQLGVSIRTKSVYADFIQPYLAGMTPSPTCPKSTDCTVCSSLSTNPQCGGGCTGTVTACTNDASCNALITCLQGCSTFACQNQCNTQNVAGLQKYEAITACTCETACPTQCGQLVDCTVSRCGLVTANTSNTCETCFQDKCCAEAWKCFSDPTCKGCFSANPNSSCATNANAQAFYQCTSQKCASPTCTFTLPNPPMTTSATTGASTTGAGGGGTGGSGSTSTTAANTTGTGGSGGKVITTGCGCSVPGQSATSNLSLGLLALTAFGFARRRRRA